MTQAIIHSDIAIIGAGAAGLSLAAGAAQLGARVVLIEANKMGGDCLNVGCVPSKSLLAAAKAQWQARHSEQFGITPNHVQTNFASVMAQLKSVIAKIAPHDSVERFESLGVTVIKAKAKFQDKHTLSANNTLVKAKRFVIASGSKPAVPPITGLEEIDYFTNETIFDMTTCPDHLMVVGGGPIGIELSQAFAMLGAKVTLLARHEILPREDRDCATIIKTALEEAGVSILENTSITSAQQNSPDMSIHYEQNNQSHTLHGSHLLIATGRQAVTRDLDLEKAEVTFNTQGIQVDRRLRTNNKKIFAMGDVIDAPKFTHVAAHHAGIVLKNICFRLPAKVDHSAVPRVTYCHPEIAHVGLTAQQIKQKNLAHTVTEFALAENDRAQTENDTVGKIKVTTDKKARILGVTIVGPHAGELLFPWVIALREKKTLRSFTDAIAPYPTLSEISKRVAGQYYSPLLFSKKTRRLVNWILKLS